MSEIRLDLRHAPKVRAYEELHAHIINVLSGTDDDIAGMATMSAMIHDSFRHLWTGFYRRVSPALLRVGPYQGTLGCLEITFGRGVCGTAAAERRTVVVKDVRAFPGHIACDSRAKSEIVVPVFGATQELIAVLDVDSERVATFDEQDRVGLEKIVTWFAGTGRRAAQQDQRT